MARGKGLGSITASCVTSCASSNGCKTNHSYLGGEGKTHEGQGFSVRGWLVASTSCFSRWYQLGPCFSQGIHIWISAEDRISA